MQPLKKTIVWLTLFSIAMGFMETAVVIYLRKIYYHQGFQFPLISVSHDLAMIEFLRETATILMLAAIGILTGKSTAQKFAFFIYSFAIWDLFYYIFLKLFINWPESVFTWDILFLIPVPWVGPVLAPCIVSITMILFMYFIIYYHDRGMNTGIKYREWILFIVGSIIVILSFMLDYFKYISHNTTKSMWTLSSNQSMFGEIATYIPAHYNWWMFAFGELIIVSGILIYRKRIKNG